MIFSKNIFNTLTDAAHKLLRPSTYKCSLCQLTHGHFGEKKNFFSKINFFLHICMRQTFSRTKNGHFDFWHKKNSSFRCKKLVLRWYKEISFVIMKFVKNYVLKSKKNSQKVLSRGRRTLILA